MVTVVILLLCVVFSHQKFDSAHPGICFLGDPWKETVTTNGITISWKDIGIQIDVPPGAVPKGKNLQLQVRPCLSGPFVLPKGYELASPVYLITPAFEFLKDVRLSIAHFVGLENSSDCDCMTIISSPSSPMYTPNPKYKFKLMKGGDFKKEANYGIISLKHFCLTGAAKQKNISSDTETQQRKDGGNFR